MKLILLGFLLFAANINTYGQAPTIQWQKCYGGNQGEVPSSIGLTFDHGYIVAGYTSTNNNGDVSGHHPGGINNDDFWVVRLDDTGKILWEKCLGSSDYDEAYSVQQTTDSGFIVAGYNKFSDGDVTGNHGDFDYWIVKLNKWGTIVWQKSFGGSGVDEAFSLKQTTDGGYIVAGTTNSTDGNITQSHGQFDMWVIKLTSSGTLAWQRTYGGSMSDEALSIAQTVDGGYILAGLSNSNDSEVTGNHGGYDYWIVKIDDSGAMEWQKSLGGSGNEAAYSIKQTHDHGYIVAGKSSSADGDVTGNHGADDFWIVKLSSAGNIEWQKSLGGSYWDNAYDVAENVDGTFAVVGMSSSEDGNISGSHGGSDYWVVELSATGGLLWEKSYGGPGNDVALSFQPTPDGGYILAGSSDAAGGDETGCHGLGDYWIVKLNRSSTLSTNNLYSHATIAVSPNPTTDIVTISGADHASVRVYNTLGQLVKQSGGNEPISLGNYPSGIYLLHVIDDNGTLIKQERIIKQ